MAKVHWSPIIYFHILHIVACQRGGVSNKPPRLRAATRHGARGPEILKEKERTVHWTRFTKTGWSWHVSGLDFLCSSPESWWKILTFSTAHSNCLLRFDDSVRFIKGGVTFGRSNSSISSSLFVTVCNHRQTRILMGLLATRVKFSL